MSYPENQNQYEDFDEYASDDLSGGQDPKPSNRTFFISFGLIAVIFALTLAALAFVVFYVLHQSREKRESQNIQIYAANTATALAATQLSESMALAAAAQTEEPTATVAATFTHSQWQRRHLNWQKFKLNLPARQVLKEQRSEAAWMDEHLPWQSFKPRQSAPV